MRILPALLLAAASSAFGAYCEGVQQCGTDATRLVVHGFDNMGAGDAERGD
jgi:hypothetical protein